MSLNVRLEKGEDVATAVDVLEDNMRVANFELSTNTLTIGIYQKCDGMLEKDAFDAKDNSWISLRFKRKTSLEKKLRSSIRGKRKLQSHGKVERQARRICREEDVQSS